MKSQVAYLIRDYADLTIAKTQMRLSSILAAATEQRQAELLTVMSELGTNILKYAGHGYIGIRRIEEEDSIDVEVFAEDDGPGIPNVELALQERFSTGNTLGLGLPAVQRMTDYMRIESKPGHGTKIYAGRRIRGEPVFSKKAFVSSRAGASQLHGEFDVGECVRPMPGQLYCGDITFYRPLNKGALLAIADATGHGAKAAGYAREVHRTLAAVPDPDNLETCLAKLDQNLKGTPGAAVGLLYVDFATGNARYAGVGNTGAMRVRGEKWRPISRDGVLGLRLPTFFQQATQLLPGDVIVLWTDGISEQVLNACVQHSHEKPATTIAYDILMRACKPYDDAGVLVLKSSAT